MSPASPPVLAVVGPTAAGKTGLGVAVARRVGGEVINTDAIQVYRGLDIGTAKATPAERQGVRHHLIDILDLNQTASVAEFQRLARVAIDGCHSRGVLPVAVGGSALYVRAVLDRFEFPGTDPALRAELEAELAAGGAEPLHRRLAALDPAAASQILASNGRRVVRALEVIALTGGQFNARLPGYELHYPGAVLAGLDVPREVLDARIDQRVRRMFADGFVDEVRDLLRRGLASAPTASRALGYPQASALLAGELSLDQAIEATVRATRRFARRQDSWFRKDPRISWLPYDAPDLVDRTLRLLDR